jgi:hypothetical protein
MTIATDVGDEHVDGIRTDVDGGKPHDAKCHPRDYQGGT